MSYIPQQYIVGSELSMEKPDHTWSLVEGGLGQWMNDGGRFYLEVGNPKQLEKLRDLYDNRFPYEGEFEPELKAFLAKAKYIHGMSCEDCKEQKFMELQAEFSKTTDKISKDLGVKFAG